MVFAILFQSLKKPKGFVLSQFFNHEGNDEKKELREQAVTAEVQEQFRFRYFADAARSLPVRNRHLITPDDVKKTVKGYKHGLFQTSTEEGCFEIPSGPLFSTPKFALWKQVNCTAITLLLEEYEDRALANNMIVLISNLMKEHFKQPNFFHTPHESLRSARFDEVLALVQLFFPSGQLILFGPTYGAQIYREMEHMFGPSKSRS